MSKVKRAEKRVAIAVILSVIFVFLLTYVSAADPTGPDSLEVMHNETKQDVGAKTINISGGRIATVNISATIQNPRWKGIVGNVTGKFTLDDAGGSTIYDWSISTITGRVYATRYSGTIKWSSVN